MQDRLKMQKQYMTMKNLQNCIDEAIVNDPKACSIVCDINYRLARHGMPLLAVSSSHKVIGEKGNLTIGIDRDEFALLGTYSTDEAIRLTELAAKIHQRGNYPYPPINVILSGNTRKGMLWVKLMDEMMGLKLKSLPYKELYRGKHYEGKALFIIVSELPVAELKRGFPKLYTDVIELSDAKDSTNK